MALSRREQSGGSLHFLGFDFLRTDFHDPYKKSRWTIEMFRKMRTRVFHCIGREFKDLVVVTLFLPLKWFIQKEECFPRGTQLSNFSLLWASRWAFSNCGQTTFPLERIMLWNWNSMKFCSNWDNENIRGRHSKGDWSKHSSNCRLFYDRWRAVSQIIVFLCRKILLWWGPVGSLNPLNPLNDIP